MDNFEKRTDSLLNRFDNRIFIDDTREEEGDFAFDELVKFLNMYPQNIDVLEKLFTLLTRNCPAGSKRTLVLDSWGGNPHEPEATNVRYIGHEDFVREGVLTIEVRLPVKDQRIADNALGIVEDFANKTELNAIIAVQITQ
ncbi:MAG: hypothetical protein K2Y22_14350 [Candidatus Obscuribacterales bacterium]|nr:hypothetical protein [Candidatus Obscuribacterales bacterium]